MDGDDESRQDRSEHQFFIVKHAHHKNLNKKVLSDSEMAETLSYLRSQPQEMLTLAQKLVIWIAEETKKIEV